MTSLMPWNAYYNINPYPPLNMSQILACTDGSVYSSSVYDHAAWAAARMSAAVHVIHALDPQKESTSLADLSGSLVADAQQALMAELVALDEARSRVAQIRGKAILAEAERHLKEAGVQKISTEQRHGSLVETLPDFEPSNDLVVIGKRGKSADFATLHLGGNLERIIRAAHKPVLVASRAFKPVNSFLIAFDGGPSAKKAVAFAASHELLKGLNCHLVMASNADQDADFTAAKQQLESAGFAVNASIIPGEPEEVIAATIEQHGVQLLVMGAWGRSRLRHLVLGSTTTSMVRTCLVPVLMFR